MPESNHPNQINRDYVRLLQMMRRFVKEEFEVSIHINQDDAVTQLLHYSAQSQNPVLKEMALELEEFTGQTPALEQEDANAPEEEAVRYYRGVAIMDESAKKPSIAAEKPEEKSRPTRVYRGRVISG